MPYPTDIPVLQALSFPMLYWGPYATDDDTRYYVGFRTGDLFITVIKSTDKGLTWTEVDAGNAMEPSLINRTISVVVGTNWPVLDPALYVIYMSATDDFIHVRRFNTDTDTWGADYASAKGYNDPAAGPDNAYNGWPCVFKPDGNIFIFGAFDAEQIPPVVGPYFWRIGWMEFDTVMNTFGAYTTLISTGGEAETWQTMSAALGSSGRVHLFYYHYDDPMTFSEHGHISVDDDGTANTPQTITVTTGFNLYDHISAAQTRVTMTGAEIYFSRVTLDVPAPDQSVYTFALVYGLSEADPTWNVTVIKTVNYDVSVGTGTIISTFTAFSDGDGIYEVIWLEEQWSGAVPTDAFILRVTSPDGAVFSAEETLVDDIPFGYVGGYFRSSGMVTATTLYAVAMNIFDNAGVGPDFNYYWEFPNVIPPTPSGLGGGGGGGGAGGWWTTSTINTFQDGRLIKKFKIPSKEANVYDCCLKRFAQLMASSVMDINPQCQLDDVLGGYTFPSLGEEFWKRGAITTPEIADGDVVVLELKVPIGYNGLIYGVSCNYSGPGFTDGAGDIEWRLKIGPVYPLGFGSVVYQLGSPEQPLQLTDHIHVRSGQLIRWIVRVVGAGIVSTTTKVTCTVQGWFYPMAVRR